MSLSKKARRAMLGTRGSASQHASIWQLKSPASQMTPLIGDLRMQLFYYCEGDADLLVANYAPSAILLPPNDTEVQPEVVATLCSGVVQYIFLDNGSDKFGRIKSAIGQDDLRFRQITLRDLEAGFMRIKNWQELIAVYHRTDGWNLAPQRHAIINLLTCRREMTVESIVRELRGESPALVLGGLAQLLRERRLDGDLDRRPWSWTTQITRRDTNP